MQELVDTGHLPGVTTMLVRHGKVVNYQVYGNKGFDGPPMTKDTVFRIYSQSKGRCHWRGDDDPLRRGQVEAGRSGQ
ncbi:serine hydrolase [Caulobacter segnis]